MAKKILPHSIVILPNQSERGYGFGGSSAGPSARPSGPATAGARLPARAPVAVGRCPMCGEMARMGEVAVLGVKFEVCEYCVETGKRAWKLGQFVFGNRK